MNKEFEINLTAEQLVVVLGLLSQTVSDLRGYINEQEDALDEAIIIASESTDEHYKKTIVDGCQLNLARLIKEKKEYEEVGAKFEKVYFNNCEYKPYFTLIPRELN